MNSSNPVQTSKKVPWTTRYSNMALFLFSATSIFYVFPSGMPQPADFVLFSAIILTFVAFMMHSVKKSKTIYMLALSFGVFTFIINFIHFVMLPDPTFLKSSFYYIYNTSAFVLVISLFKRTPSTTWKALYFGLVFSILIEFAIIKLFPSLRGYRETGTFSNPNQLAVWALAASCLLILLKAKIRMNQFDVFLLLLLGYMQTLSLSKAGIICFGIVSLSLLFIPALSRNIKIVFAVLCLGLVFYGVFETTRLAETIQKFENIEKVFSRLETIGEGGDDSLEGRGYQRIFEHPEFLILGAGEGGHARFALFNKALEMHSGLGTIAFSYGIIGFGLFSFLLYAIIKRNSPLVLIIIGVLLLYGLTHQNIRLRHFWLVLGVCYVVREINFKTFTPYQLEAKPAHL